MAQRTASSAQGGRRRFLTAPTGSGLTSSSGSAPSGTWVSLLKINIGMACNQTLTLLLMRLSYYHLTVVKGVFQSVSI